MIRNAKRSLFMDDICIRCKHNHIYIYLVVAQNLVFQGARHQSAHCHNLAADQQGGHNLAAEGAELHILAEGVGLHTLAEGVGLHILAAEREGGHTPVGVVLLHTAVVQVEARTLLAGVVHTPGVDNPVEVEAHNLAVADLKIADKLLSLYMYVLSKADTDLSKLSKEDI